MKGAVFMHKIFQVWSRNVFIFGATAISAFMSACSIEVTINDLRNKDLASKSEELELGEHVLVGWEQIQLNNGAVILAKQDEWAERIQLTNGAEIEVKRNF
jgi:hypothetical protein